MERSKEMKEMIQSKVNKLVMQLRRITTEILVSYTLTIFTPVSVLTIMWWSEDVDSLSAQFILVILHWSDVLSRYYD